MVARTRITLIAVMTCGALASRVGSARIQEHSFQEHNQSVQATGQGWSPWKLSIDGVSCLSLDPKPFGGLPTHWPKAWGEAVKEAEKLGTKGNCKLCDVVFEGSKIEADMSWKSTGCNAKVKCSAVRGVGESACFPGKDGGKLLSIYGVNIKQKHIDYYPDNVCQVCPAGCKECHDGGSGAFKCVVRPTGDANTGERCVMPEGFKCSNCHKRTCSGMFNFGCSRSDYKADCEYPESYANEKPQWTAPEDYELTVKGGKDKAALPPVWEYLSGSK